MLSRLEFHPYAGLFPLMSEVERAEQREDIRLHGLRDPIDIFDAKILDGRNRYLVLLDLQTSGAARGRGWGIYEGTCLSPADLEPGNRNPLFRAYSMTEHGDPLDYVISKNLPRRHLTDDQRRMVAARLVNMGRGRPSENAADCGINRKQAANRLSTDEAGVERARTVVTRGIEELQGAVDEGEISVSAASEIARKPAEEQRDELARRGIGQSPHTANRIGDAEGLDYSPTAPWATRALMEHVIPYVEVWPDDLSTATVHEPASGEGHMSAVLQEYFGAVIASDIHDYSVDGRSPPGWEGVADFLAPETSRPG